MRAVVEVACRYRQVSVVVYPPFWMCTYHIPIVGKGENEARIQPQLAGDRAGNTASLGKSLYPVFSPCWVFDYREFGVLIEGRVALHASAKPVDPAQY